MQEIKNLHRLSCEKPIVKGTATLRPKMALEDNIKMNLREIGELELGGSNQSCRFVDCGVELSGYTTKNLIRHVFGLQIMIYC
jgi:hypothetical protein